MKKLLVAVLALLFFSQPVLAVEPGEMLDDPVLEARARELSTGLRCLVCKNQNIDESNAGLARDLRILVRERLVAGDTNEEAMGYIVSKYGEYVLLKPKFALHTLILWLGPFVLLIVGAGVLLKMRSRKPTTVAEKELSEEEKKQLQDLMQ